MFKKELITCIQYINVSLIIDDLDEIRINDLEHSIKFLINLVTKVKEINLELTDVNENSKCILLLRTDIINLFSSRSSNIQKVLSDCNIELFWFHDESGQELSDMIMHKIKSSTNISELSNYSFSEIRKKVFKNEKNKDSFDKIVDYSFGRPRDVITYLKCIKSQFPDSKEIDFSLVSAVESTYSRKILSELKNEMSFTLESETIEEIEELLRNFGKRNFYYKDLLAYYNECIENYQHIRNLENILQYLYKLGVIGNRSSVVSKNKKKKNKSNRFIYIYSWSYRNGGDKLMIDKEISVHHSVKKALNI